jgi:hypothetical protein
VIFHSYVTVYQRVIRISEGEILHFREPNNSQSETGRSPYN